LTSALGSVSWDSDDGATAEGTDHPFRDVGNVIGALDEAQKHTTAYFPGSSQTCLAAVVSAGPRGFHAAVRHCPRWRRAARHVLHSLLPCESAKPSCPVSGLNLAGRVVEASLTPHSVQIESIVRPAGIVSAPRNANSLAVREADHEFGRQQLAALEPGAPEAWLAWQLYLGRRGYPDFAHPGQT
jgi:hypothetical protein